VPAVDLLADVVGAMPPRQILERWARRAGPLTAELALRVMIEMQLLVPSPT